MPFIQTITTALTVITASVAHHPPRPLHDIPLPQPLPEAVLILLLIASFLLHILFVNLMIGGALLTLWSEIKGLKESRYDRLAREIAATVTVNKSLAVVLGVAPLLTINTLYTVFFYSANVLTGEMWISIVPLLTVAFLLLYLHKYTWDKLSESPGRKKIHIGILVLAVCILLFIPLIFLANINLMLFPDRWSDVRGFFSAIFMANVWPRYLHFLCATLAVTGLFLFGYMKRRGYPFQEKYDGLFGDGAVVLKRWYHITLGASLTQLLLGPLNLFTLPWSAVSWSMIAVISAGAVAALGAMLIIWRELKGAPENLGKRFYLAAAILTVTVLFMGTGRHLYRAEALKPHLQKMKEKTVPFSRETPAPPASPLSSGPE